MREKRTQGWSMEKGELAPKDYKVQGNLRKERARVIVPNLLRGPFFSSLIAEIEETPW
jgi:hypothetical protein